MQLRGHFVKDDLFYLKILSIHEGVINLFDEESKLIISLIKNKKHMTGLSLLVPDLFQIHEDFPEPGFSISLEGLGINYSNAQKWTGYVPPNLNNIDSIKKNEVLVLKTQIDSGDSFLSLLTKSSFTPFQLKAEKILTNQVKVENKMMRGLENMVGLGQGLTPSGDDFITGALLAEACTGNSDSIQKKTIESKLEKTTYPGKTLLTLALMGSFPEYLLTFLNERSSAFKKNDILLVINKASDHGSTSGKDSLAGFYWYLSYLFSSGKIS